MRCCRSRGRRFYDEPKGETEMNLDLMGLIHCPAVAACSDERDKQFLETPFYGGRQPIGTLPTVIPCRPVDEMAFA